MIRPSARVARWREIEAELERRIASGTYVGGRLPTEHALADEFAVNRHTVRQALQGFKERGVLDTRQGRGSAVRPGVFEYALGLRTRFSQNLAKQHTSGLMEVLAIEVERAERDVARMLDLLVGTRVERVETLGIADGLPLSASRHWFAARRFGGIGEAIAEQGSITRALKAFGVADYVRASTRIVAQLPDATLAYRLRIGAGQPVIVLRAVNVDAAQRPIQASETVFAADRVELLVEHAQP